MKRFVVPSEWPPPERGWAPTRDWRPHPSWPEPSADHRFWVNDAGKPVTGPIGYYGGPSKRAIFSWTGAATAFVGVNIWALMMLGIAGNHQSDPQAEQTIGITTPTPKPRTSVTVTPTTRPPWTETSPGRAAPKPSRAVSEKPARTQTRTPKPTKPTPRPTTPRPTVAPTPTTPDELARAYCQQRGWDPSWCPPPGWQFTPTPRSGM